MARRVFMWIAVASLAGFALANAASALARYTAGRIFYTSSGQPSDPLAVQIIEASSSAQMFLVPIAALSLAAYILLLDRDVRRGSNSRGFDVEPTRPGESKGTRFEPSPHDETRITNK